MNKIMIHGDIARWNMSASWLKWQLENKTVELEVDIFSYGGDVFEGIAMYNMLREYSKTKGQVTTINSSMCASIASLLFLAGDKRKAHENSTIMIHKSWMWTAGNYDDLMQNAKMLDGIDNVMVNIYSKTMKKEKEEIKDILAKEGWYIGKDQMQGTNFVDEFIPDNNSRVELTQAKATYNQTVKSISARAKDENIEHDFKSTMMLLKECNDGKCPLESVEVKENSTEANPTASGDNSKFKTTGADMVFDRENLDATEATFKALVLNRDTLTGRMNSLEMSLQTANTALATKNEEMEALKADMEAKVTEAEGKFASFQTEVQTRMAEAIATGADVSIAAEMLKAETAEDASKIALEAKKSDGGTPQGGNQTKPSKLLAYANKNKGKLK